jgi:hypothetical protein
MSAGRGYSRKYKVDDHVTTKVISWTAGISKEKQTPFIRVSLEGGITWTGWCKSDKSKEITINCLQVMGFKGTDLSQIKNDNALDTERDVVAVIGEVRPWKDAVYYDAKFINRAKKKGFQADDKNNAVFETLKDIDTTAQIEDAKDLNAGDGSLPASYEGTNFTPNDFAAEEIPF